MVSSRVVISSAVALLAAFPSVHATARGLAWATNNDFAPIIGGKPMISWYHHWQDGPVPQMPSKNEYVPMFWGNKKWGDWNSRKAEMAKNTPKHLLAFNEPDISSQGDMSASYAADVWMQEIHPWGKKGVKLGSPAVAWDLNWTNDFINELKKRGGYMDFVTVHWYGSYKDIEGFKKYVASARSRFGYKVWVTELGVTTGSNPTQQQTKDFMMQAYSWMDSTGYVDRASWFGCFEASQPPDGYATGKNALFKAAWTLSDMGYWYGYSSKPDRRDVDANPNIKSRHHAIAARLNATATEPDTDDTDAVHCDKICTLRNAALEAYELASAAPAEEL